MAGRGPGQEFLLRRWYQFPRARPTPGAGGPAPTPSDDRAYAKLVGGSLPGPPVTLPPREPPCSSPPSDSRSSSPWSCRRAGCSCPCPGGADAGWRTARRRHGQPWIVPAGMIGAAALLGPLAPSDGWPTALQGARLAGRPGPGRRRRRALVRPRGPHPVERVHAGRQLRLLRQLRLALRGPAGRVDRGQPGPGRASSTASEDDARRRAVARRRRSSPTSACWRGSSTRASSPRARRASSGRSASTFDPPARAIIPPVGISFFTFQALSYVIDIYRRKLDPVAAARLRRLPLVLPAPGGRADRAGRRSSCPSSATPRDARRVDSRPGLLADRRRPVQEGGGRPATWPTPSSTRSSPPRRSTQAVETLLGDLRLRHPDLLRLLRLHRHGHRPGPAARLPVPAELRRALHRRVAPGLLAPLAHDAVALAARLPLHPARRQPARAPTGPYVNLFLTMLIGGLWHGAAWTFVVGARSTAAWLAGERLVGTDAAPPSSAASVAADERRPVPAATGACRGRRRAPARPTTTRSSGRRRRARRRSRHGARRRPSGAAAAPVVADRALSPTTRRWLGRLITFHVVCLGWVFFRAADPHRGVRRPAAACSTFGHRHRRQPHGGGHHRHVPRHAVRAHRRRRPGPGLLLPPAGLAAGHRPRPSGWPSPAPSPPPAWPRSSTSPSEPWPTSTTSPRARAATPTSPPARRWRSCSWRCSWARSSTPTGIDNTAHTQPFGWQRTWALRITGPLTAVSRRHRPQPAPPVPGGRGRQRARPAARGHRHRGGRPSGHHAPDPPPPPPRRPPPEHRVPTAGGPRPDPGGRRLADGLDRPRPRPGLDGKPVTVTEDWEVGTGLARPDVVNWPARLGRGHGGTTPRWWWSASAATTPATWPPTTAGSASARRSGPPSTSAGWPRCSTRVEGPNRTVYWIGLPVTTRGDIEEAAPGHGRGRAAPRSRPGRGPTTSTPGRPSPTTARTPPTCPTARASEVKVREDDGVHPNLGRRPPASWRPVVRASSLDRAQARPDGPGRPTLYQ